MKRPKKSDKSLILLLLIVVTIAATVVFGILQFRIDNFTRKIKEKEPLAFLFVVTDEEDLLFIDLFLYHPGTKKGSLFYIPPNLGVKIVTLDRFDKINILYDPEDIQPFKKKLEELLDIPISFYMDISLDNVANIVDLLGGLELFISNPLDSMYGEKRILLPSGSVLLDGDKIKDFIMYEDEIEEDREKAGRRHKFLAALIKKLGNPTAKAFLLDSDVFKYFKGYMSTNLNAQALKSFILELGKLKSDNLLFQRVLGNPKNVNGVEGIVIFPHYEGNLIKQTIKQNLETIASTDPKYDDTMVVKLEILNGTNVDGLARRTKTLFESFGFDVISYGNADNDQYLNTLVLDRKGKVHAAERVAEVIQCVRIFPKLDQDVNSDITLVLGKDFDGRYCKK